MIRHDVDRSDEGRREEISHNMHRRLCGMERYTY